MSAHPLTASHGFTLVEALLAIGLMAGAGVAMASLGLVAARTVRDGRDRTLAALAADAVLADTARPNAAATVSSCLTDDAAGCHDGIDADGRPAASAAGGVYRRRWRVRDHTPGLVPGRVIAACVGPLGAMRPAVGGRPAGTCLITVSVEVRP